MKRVKEGRAIIHVPEESLTRKSETFYNPGMEYQRNITIASLRVLQPKRILDPLAASGVRGIRILKEVEGVEKVVFNDVNPKAVKLIKKNLKANRIDKSRYEVYQKEANTLFIEKGKFGFVDVDPFGSPAKFLENAGYSLGKDSIIGITATDTGALSGKFPDACLRRYGVKVGRTDFPKELGVRVLITATILNLAKHKMTFKPLYSHANHYFRVMGRVSYGHEDNLKKIRMISYCPECHAKSLGVMKACRNCGGRVSTIGPLWAGEIQDRVFCGKLLAKFDFRNNKEIVMCSQEIDEPFYYDLHKLAKSTKKSSPKIDVLIKKLNDKGFEASRTHLCLTGLKTNASVKEILKT